MNYLNNPHHIDVLSYGRRHIASVDVSMVGNSFRHTNSYYQFARATSIIDHIVSNIDQQEYYIFKPKALKIGNITFKKFTNEDNQTSLKISIKGGGTFSSTSDTWCNLRFVDWFTQYYDFSSYGEFEKGLLGLVSEYYNKLIDFCIKEFHLQCNPAVNRGQFNPEVCARNISFCFWSCVTMLNAIEINSYDNLEVAKNNSSAYYVNAFEDIVNKINGTDYKYSRMYYNNNSTEREQEYNYQMVRVALGLN